MKRLLYSLPLLLIVGLSFTLGQQTGSAQRPTLQLNQSLTRTIKAGETQEFHLALKAGEFMQVEALQKGVDVVLKLYSPDGKLLLERDSPNSTDGPEPLSCLADATGRYKLTVSVWEQAEAKEGSYTIELKTLRQPTPRDRQRIAAETLFRDALILGNQAQALRNENKTEEAKKLSVQSRAKYQESLPLWRALDEKYWEALTLETINSYESLAEAAKRYGELSHKKRAQELWLELGNVYAKSAEWKQARASYESGLALAKERNDTQVIAFAQQRLSEAKARLLLADGRQLSRSGHKSKAITALNEALREVRRTIGLTELETEVLEALGQIYLDSNKLMEAKELFQQTLKIVRGSSLIGSFVRNSRNLELINTTLLSNAIRAELIVQSGHTSFVNTVAFSPKGGMVASGSADKTIKLWDTISGSELRTLSGHNGDVCAIAFSPNGQWLASASSDTTVKLWDVASGVILRTFSKHTGAVTSITFSPDGRMLASGSTDKTIQLWDAISGVELRAFLGHEGEVRTIAFSPDGRWLASGCWKNAIILWSVSSGALLRTFAGHTSGGVSSIAFSPDGRTLASGTRDWTSLPSPDGQTFARDSRNWTVKLWDVISGSELRTLSGHTDEVTSVAFSPDGRMLASGSTDMTIKLWDIASNSELHTLSGHSGRVSTVAFSPDGRTLTSGSGQMSLILGRPWERGDKNWTVKLWDVASGKEMRSPSMHTEGITFAALAPDGRTLASGGWDNTIKLWDVISGSEFRTLSGHKGQVNSAAFSTDGRILATASDDRTIKIWDVASGMELRTLSRHEGWVRSVAFTPDGQTLASISNDGTIKIWDVSSGIELRTLLGQPGISVSFSLDGRLLASGGNSETIVLWMVATGTQLRTFSIPGFWVKSVAFAMDGKTLMSTSWNDTVKSWDVATGMERSLADLMPVWVTAANNNFILRPINGKQVLFATDGVQIKLINYATGERLCSLIALNQKDWAVVTPNGLFDASPGAMKLMHFVISGLEEGYAVIALEDMQGRYYQPNLLAKLLGFDKTPIREVTHFTGEKLYPKIEYRWQQSKSTKLEIKLKNRGGGIGEISVLVNGNTWLKDVRPPGFDKNAKEAAFTVDLKDAPFLIGALDQVEVVARNAEGWLTSARGSTIVYDVETEAAKPNPELWAIIGGISDYEGTQLDLSFAAKDAEDFANAVKLGGYRLFGADRVHLQLLTTNSQDPRLLPTKENFRRVFAEFQRAKPNDVLLVYLSGHGVAFRLDGDQVLYSYLTQTATSGDLKDSDVRNRDAITSDELMDWIRAIKTNKNVLLFDTCAAGAFADNLNLAIKKDDVGEYTDNQKRALSQLRQRTAFHILMGSAANKPSYETSQFNQGLLTRALLEGIQYGAVNRDRVVNVNELFQFARKRVEELADSIGNRYIQTPQLSSPEGDNLPLLLMSQEDAAAIRLEQARPFVMRPRLVNLDNRRDFEIEKRLIQRLRAFNQVGQSGQRGAAGRTAPLIYLEDVELPIAIAPNGDYKYEGDQVTVNLDLLRGDQVVGTLTIVGKKNDLNGLVEKIIAEMGVALGKLPRYVAEPPK